MTIKRVHYREEQRLLEDDLQDEQAYQISARRRHNIAHHGWGIVQGLTLQADIAGINGVIVNPGFAIDGYGRELIVAKKLTLDKNIFKELLAAQLNSNTEHYLDVWLTYCLRQLSIKPDGSHSREAEEALLKLNCTSSNTVIDPYFPWEVPINDQNFQAYRDPPDDPEMEWPVYLGRIGVNGTDYRIKKVQRAYATLKGATLRAPWGEDWLHLSSEEKDDNRRFAISLPAANGFMQDRMVLDDQGDLTFTGQVTTNNIKNDSNNLLGSSAVVLKGSANELKFGGGLHFRRSISTPELAAPWQIYRTETEKVVNNQQIPQEELRFEILNPGEEGEPSRYKFVMGDSLNDTLSVRSDHNVIINADLHVAGQIIEGAIPLDVDDKRFRDAMLNRWTDGLTTAGTEVEAYYDSNLVLDRIKVNGAFEPFNDVNGDDPTLISLFITNNSSARDIPIVSVTGELRDTQRRLIYSKLFNLDTHSDYPIIIPSNDNKEASLNLIFNEKKIKGTVTLTIKVVSLSVAQNTVEAQTSAVINII